MIRELVCSEIQFLIKKEEMNKNPQLNMEKGSILNLIDYLPPNEPNLEY